jgi:hypothetical protein
MPPMPRHRPISAGRWTAPAMLACGLLPLLLPALCSKHAPAVADDVPAGGGEPTKATTDPVETYAAASDRAVQTDPRHARSANPAADLELPFRMSVELLVRDTFDLPVENARLYLAPRGAALGVVASPTDALGRLRFEFDSRGRTTEVWAVVVSRGIAEWMQLLTLRAGETFTLRTTARGEFADTTKIDRMLDRMLDGDVDESELDLLLRRAHSLGPYRGIRLPLDTEEHADAQDARLRVRRPQRRGWEPTGDHISCGRMLWLFAEMDCTTCHLASDLIAYAPLQWAADLRPGLHPSAVFRSLRSTPPDQDERRMRRERRAGRRTTLQPDDGLPATAVTGTVRLPSGQPPEPVAVAWVDAAGAVLQRSLSDEEGRYRIDVKPGELVRLRLGGGGSGLAEFEALLHPGERLERDVVLQPQPSLTGHALNEEGNPLGRWRVHFDGEDYGPSLVETDGEGQFLLTSKALRGTLALLPPGPSPCLPVLTTEAVMVPARGLRLQRPTDRSTRARLRVTPLLPAGFDPGRVELRIVQVQSGFATHMQGTGFENAFDVDDLAAGTYCGEIGSPGLGWVAFGPIQIDGRGLWDLGTVSLAPPGRAHFACLRDEDAADDRATPHPFDGAWSLIRQLPEHDLMVFPRPEEMRRTDRILTLAQGRYAVVWRNAGDAPDEVRSAAFEVRAGTTTEVVLDCR